jgi:hypothetical protein
MAPSPRGAEDGEQWWQRGSPFERHMQDCIKGETGALSLQRLHWLGLNSETSREAAAQALLDRCRTLERTGERYVLIGTHTAAPSLATRCC